MKPLMIGDGIYSVGVQNPDLRTFDIIMSTDYGTTYNAYLVKGTEKVALIDTVKTNFSELFTQYIRHVADLKDIGYIVVNHTEPDHSGSLKDILEAIPDIKVIATRAGHQYAKEIVNRSYNAVVVNDGDVIDLGGKKLRFITAPFLHWPDTMFTYVEEDGVLFSCDAFGTHYCEDGMMTEPIRAIKDKDAYERMFRFYFDVIMSPFREHVLKAVEKIKDLDIKAICPSHGPLLLENPRERVELYRQWSSTVYDKNDPKKVLIAYVSAYGCTEKLAHAIADGVRSAGAEANVVNVEKADLWELREKIEQHDGLIFGSPTINKDAVKPIWDAIGMIDVIKNRGKMCAAFGSYGWSGEGVKQMEDRLKGMRMNVVEPGAKAIFVPSAEELVKAADFGKEFAEKLLQHE